jgi:putative MFS transporter
MWLQERIGRKWALFAMSGTAAIFLMLFGLSFQWKMPIQFIVGAQVISQLATSGVVSIMFTLSAELFPTSVRALAGGLINGVGRFGAVIGPYVLGFLLTKRLPISHILYFYAGPLVIAALVAVFTLRVDPRRKTLEEIGLAEGERQG